MAASEGARRMAVPCDCCGDRIPEADGYACPSCINWYCEDCLEDHGCPCVPSLYRDAIAERDRYRAALEIYGDRTNWAGLGPCDDVQQWQRMNEPGWTIADEALRPKGGEGNTT